MTNENKEMADTLKQQYQEAFSKNIPENEIKNPREFFSQEERSHMGFEPLEDVHFNEEDVI